MKKLNLIVTVALILSLIGVQAQIVSLRNMQGNFGDVTFPTIVALFESSLASKITSSATTMTLVSATDKQGNSLSGSYAFIVDEGSSNEEFVRCTVAGTALSACTRGLSVTDGKTSVTALKFEHRRGASVKITDHPQVALLTQALNGQQGIPNTLYYSTALVPAVASNSLAQWDYIKAYADGLANTGAANATTIVQGLVELGTFAEIASGTTYGATGAALVLTSKDLVNSKLSNHSFFGATGDSDSYAITVSGVASLSAGMEFTFIASDSNIGNATINVNGLGALNLLRQDGTTLADQDVGPQSVVKAVYTASTFRLLDRIEMPVGAISAYASISAPNGWLKADGSAVSRTTYARLFKLLGTRYGTGDGSTTFNVPQLGNRNIIGISTNVASASFGTLGNVGGQASHSMTIGELVPHTHTYTGAQSEGSSALNSGAFGVAGSQISVDSTGGGQKFSLMDPYIVLQYIIKY